MRVEHVVGRQRVLVGLIRAQLGGRRLGDRRLRNDPPGRAERAVGVMRVAPSRQRVDLGLVDVLQHRVAAAHVAVERGVADRHLRLVAGRHAACSPNLFESAISSRPRTRACRFSSVTSRGAAGEERRPAPTRRRRRRSSIGSVSSGHAEEPRRLLGVVEAGRRREPRRQPHAAHARRRRARRRRRRRSARSRCRPTGRARRPGSRSCARSRAGRAPSRGRPTASRGSSAHAAPPSQRRPPPLRSQRVTLHRLAPGRQRARQLPVGVHDERSAVEDELVLAADLVDVGERQAGLARRARARGRRRCCDFSTSNGEPFGTSSSSAPCARQVLRGVGEPDVLADRQPEPHAAELDRRRAAAPARRRASRRRRRSWAARA